jgi:trehalose 6-phosphate synthase/phosphatase
VLEIAEPTDHIWIHDYQLMLLPAMLRSALPTVRIGFFLHIPFPSSEIFRMLPWRSEILEGLIGADLIGFHSFSYARHFLSSLLRILGLDSEYGRVSLANRTLRVDTFPLGVDVERITELADEPPVLERLAELEEEAGGRKIVLSIDRLDFTKGILHRLRAFERFLEQHKHWQNKVTLISLCVPSRTRVPEYQSLKREVDELVGRINGEFGRPGWVPIWYLYRQLPFEELMPLYQLGDVALVTPLRDGMNLVSKEYLAARRDQTGVLVLSETAGSAEELGEAIIVNPFDEQGMVEALDRALQMPEEEQKRRNRPMLARLRRYDVYRWADDFLNQLEDVSGERPTERPESLTESDLERLLTAYREAERRLLLLDYDGTLAEIAPRPQQAAPNDRLISLLRQLADVRGNTVVVISGRDHETIGGWLEKAGVHLVAEHGARFRLSHRAAWEQSTESLTDEWKERLRPVLQTYADRTPGTSLEEKSAALAWHYRNAEPEMGSHRAIELIETLEGITANTPLNVLHGRKVVEVKHANINKGQAIMRWLNQDPAYEFVLALGDDLTDEDMFRVLSGDCWSIKVGWDAQSAARFALPSPAAVRGLLQRLAST